MVELDRPLRKTDDYKKRGVDAMGIFDSKNHKFYLIPIRNIKNKTGIWIRLDHAKNFQKKNINLAQNYII